MTKVNNGKITSSGTAAITTRNTHSSKSTTSTKAAAVLARLDEMSVSLADELSHYRGNVDEDATFDLSVKEETLGRKLTNAGAAPKTLETLLEHPKSQAKNGNEEGSSGEDSTIVEEVSYVLARRNNKSSQQNDKDEAPASKTFSNVQPKIRNGPFTTERDKRCERFVSDHVAATSYAASAVKFSTEIKEKNARLQTPRILGSCSFDDSASEASSDGGFSIEEAEEEEVIAFETTPVLPPMLNKAPLVQRGSSKTKQRHIQSYVYSLSFDESVLDDASILDLQMSKTPKIKNKKMLVGESPGSHQTSFASRSVSSGSAPSHHSSTLNRKKNSDVATNTVSSTKTEGETASTAKSPARTTSWIPFSREIPSAVIAECKRGSSNHSTTSSCQRSRLIQFNPPSQLMIDVESGSASRQGEKRNNGSSSSSRVGTALSLDETEAIIGDAIISMNQATKRRKMTICFSAAAVFLLASLAVLAVLVSKKMVPGFLHEPLSNLSVISTSPISSNNTSADPKGVRDTVWYADFDLFKCVRNCTSEGAIESAPCGGKMNRWDKGFDTLEECCLENFSSFIGKDWSLRDCMLISYPEFFSIEAGDSEATVPANAPTYMPTAGVHVEKPDQQEHVNKPPAETKTEATAQSMGSTFVTEHKATSIAYEETPSFVPTKVVDDEIRPLAPGTTLWAVNNEENDSSTYVLELDENYNPINPTTGAATVAVVTSEMPLYTSVATKATAIESDHVAVVAETTATTAIPSEFQSTAAVVTTAATSTTNSSTVATAYVLVYYADWDQKTCLLTGKVELQPWQKMYSTENECCSDNFSWYVNGTCFKGEGQSNLIGVANSSSVPSSSAVSTVQPFAKPTLLPSTPISTSKPSAKPTLKPVTASPTNHPTRTIVVYIPFNEKKCIQVSKSTLKDNVTNYESEEECCLDNNFSDCQPIKFPSVYPTEALETQSPTDKPSREMTLKPSRSPTQNLTVSTFASSAAVSKSGSNDCTLEFCNYQMSPDYLLEYRVNIPDGTPYDACSGCTISVKLTYNGETSWIGFAFSTTGEMIGSEAIIGVPGMTPAKYYLGGKYDSAVQLMEQSKQTLLSSKVEVVDGLTVLSFTKLLVEKNEIEISFGENIFLWAHGTDADTTSHMGNRGSFRLNLSSQSDNQLVTPSPTGKQSNRLTTIKPSHRPSSKPNPIPTKKPTSSLVPAILQTNISQSPTYNSLNSLTALLLSKSPNSTESLADKTSAQYLAMKWLSKNPDLSEITDERKVQRWVLATFYKSLHGDEWTFLDGWLDISGDVEECTWYNVSCDSSGYVVSLHLKNNYLWGSIPMEISLLDKCEYLGLSSNYLRYIQPTIFDMKNLKVLDMEDNGIHMIPTEINTSTKLEELYLSHNKITSIPDVIFELTDLKAFFIFDNWIASTVPSKIGQLTLLEELNLDMNYFTGQLPDDLYLLSNLKKLSLFGNMIAGQLSPKLSRMSSLNVLDLSQNYLSGELPTEIGLLKNITELHLTKNFISGQLPRELSKLTSLTVLDISMNHLNSTIMSEIGALDNLIALRLDNNYRLGENSSLVSSGLQGTIPSSIGNLKHLRELRLDNNYIQGPLPTELGNLLSIEILRIEENDIHGSIPSQLGNAVSLQYLHLWSNYIGGTIPATLGNLVELKELFLDDNELTGSIPRELGGLTSATYIALASNNLESTIPSEFGMLSSIEKLELQSNFLYGEVPKELGGLSLVLLQLEDNFLYGDIPDEVCKSSAIKYLSGSCPVPRQTSSAPVSSRTTTDSQTQALVSARNGGRATGVGASRKRNERITRNLAKNTPTSSPTLEYWWSCNCCTECLSL